MRLFVGRVLNHLLRPLELEIRKLKPALPPRQYINVFELCVQDLMKRGKMPFLLQIGANDGIANDPVRDLIVSYRLPSLLIEPHPVAFESLKKNYEPYPFVRTRNFAIADVDGSISFFVPTDDLIRAFPRTHRLCSLDRGQLHKALSEVGIDNPTDKISEIKINAKTIPSLFEDEQLEQIDILQIDAEGYDWKIVSQFDLAALHIPLINLEFFNLSAEEQHACLKSLTLAGYQTSDFFGDLVAYKPSPSL
jgi:FkbM family methyltransferase